MECIPYLVVAPVSCKGWLGGNKVPDILARRIIRAPQEARSWHRSLLRNAWDQLPAALRACGGAPVLLPHGRSVVDGGEEPSLHTVFEDVEHPVDLCVFQQDFSFSADPRCAAVQKHVVRDGRFELKAAAEDYRG